MYQTLVIFVTWYTTQLAMYDAKIINAILFSKNYITSQVFSRFNFQLKQLSKFNH